jgi:hypothetical protein
MVLARDCAVLEVVRVDAERNLLLVKVPFLKVLAAVWLTVQQPASRLRKLTCD